jgi:hypothetical protein
MALGSDSALESGPIPGNAVPPPAGSAFATQSANSRHSQWVPEAEARTCCDLAFQKKRSIHPLEIARLPTLVEPGLQRTIEP